MVKVTLYLSDNTIESISALTGSSCTWNRVVSFSTIDGRDRAFSHETGCICRSRYLAIRSVIVDRDFISASIASGMIFLRRLCQTLDGSLIGIPWVMPLTCLKRIVVPERGGPRIR